MTDGIGEDRSEFCALFVAGSAEQRPGSAIALLAAALYCWLFRWNYRAHVRQASPPVSGTMLSGAGSGCDDLTHLTLAVPFLLSTGERDLAGSRRNGRRPSCSPVRIVGVARGIWKASTYLMVAAVRDEPRYQVERCVYCD